ncbi:MAG TPA: alpha/beta hydrolase [Rhizomicrobium sp.]|nr:alpha/beta hydrolase [Rhizomicrobium sp.]
MASIYKTETGGQALQQRYRELLAFWPVPNEQLWIPTRQGETFVIASGDKAAPPLILLHGSGGNSIVWMRDIAEWSKQFRVFAVDVIGEPGLSAASRPPLASDLYAQWLADAFDALSLEDASIVGVSLGGWLALDFATRNPARVRRLVLLCPGGVGRQKSAFLFKAMFLMLFGAWGRRKALSLALGRMAANANPEATAYMSSVFREFRPRRETLPIFSDEDLKRLTMPVLLIVGGEDAMLDSQETCARLARSVPNLTARELPGTGHLITGQTATITAFLASG